MVSKRDLLMKRLNENQRAHQVSAQAADVEERETIEMISVDRVQVNPFQPRLAFGDEALQSLTESIRAEGLLQPIMVRPNGARGYQLICGERRLRAIRALGHTHVRAVIATKSDLQSATSALSENLKRADLSDFEISEAVSAIEALMRDAQGEVSKEALRKAVGLSRAALYRALSFQTLPESVRARLKSEPALLSGTVAEELKKSISSYEPLSQAHLNHLHHLLDRLQNDEIRQKDLTPLFTASINEENEREEPHSSTEAIDQSESIPQDNAETAPHRVQQDTFNEVAPKAFRIGRKKVGQLRVSNHELMISLNRSMLSTSQIERIQSAITEALKHP